MKKLTSLLLSAALMLGLSLPVHAAANSAVKLTLDGAEAGTVQCLSVEGVDYAPVRKVAETLGWTVAWQGGDAWRVTLTKGEDAVQIDLDQPVIQRNGFGVKLAAPLKLVENTAYLPLKNLADALQVKAALTKEALALTTVGQVDVTKLENLGDAGQVILVTAADHGQTLVRVTAYEKGAEGWTQVLDTLGVIGRSGFGDSKKEGDGRSPVGAFTLGTAFGTAVNPDTKMAYIQTGEDDIWVDDDQSVYYNTWQKRSAIPADSFTSHEDLAITAYEYAFVIDYNTKTIVPGDGSAIFFHVKGATSTAGCTAVEKDDIVTLLQWLDPAKNPVILQGAVGEIAGLAAAE